jgi:pantoate--beta-alanine ligase
MRVVGTFGEARRHLSGRVGLVPTMGFLHEGHLRLIEASVDRADTTVVTVFVNPLQFGDPDDLSRYPRDVERDTDLAAAAGADLLLAPTVADMYPSHPRTTVTVSEVADEMEGRYRPGHFDGVATVVTKLLAGVDPDLAFFGRKDAQQLAVVTTLASDLSFKVDVVGCPIVREQDGLALSSRNVRLGSEDRRRATAISRTLMGLADRIESGTSDVPSLLSDATEALHAVAGLELDYVELADARSAAPMRELVGGQFIAVAARIGDVRLIDAITIENGVVDRGVRLSRPSILYGGP